MTSKLPRKAWVITVDMGYGHQRASFPLRHLAEGDIITANIYPGIPEEDKKVWLNSRRFYEFISRFKKFPLIGEKAFELFDKLQSIPVFYPRRDLSKPNIQLKEIYSLFKNKDWGKHLIDKLSKKPLPLVTTFFAIAMMAEFFNYDGEIYCVICDADVSRSWAPLDPQSSRINYFAPNRRVADRLKLYGIREEKIFLTGFPLPDENVGLDLKTVKNDLGRRLVHLDPDKVFLSQYKDTVLKQIGRNYLKAKELDPVTITFAVGGAGAQRELGAVIVSSLKKEILANKININLVAGIQLPVSHYFHDVVRDMGLNKKLNNGIDIIFCPTKDEYFSKFNHLLRYTDILWTKPSELTFYSALGLPIVMAPPIGSQEIFNRHWLQSIGAGIRQEDPRYTNEWLFDWLKSGWLAEAAMQGFLEAPRYGTYNIEKIIFNEEAEARKIVSVLQY